MKECLSGNLLVASSLVDDAFASQGVCLLVHHDADTAIGVMLNRPMRHDAGAMLKILSDASGDSPQSAAADQRPASRLPKPAETDEVDFPGQTPTSSGGPGPARGSKPSAGHALHFGGPLSGPVVAVHNLSEHAEAETGTGIYVAAERDHLEQIIRQNLGPYRLIVGHVGWQSDELLRQIESGLWHVLPATPEAVFASDNIMWPRLIRRATASSVASWLGVPDVPDAHQLN